MNIEHYIWECPLLCFFGDTAGRETWVIWFFLFEGRRCSTLGTLYIGGIFLCACRFGGINLSERAAAGSNEVRKYALETSVASGNSEVWQTNCINIEKAAIKITAANWGWYTWFDFMVLWLWVVHRITKAYWQFLLAISKGAIEQRTIYGRFENKFPAYLQLVK